MVRMMTIAMIGRSKGNVSLVKHPDLARAIQPAGFVDSHRESSADPQKIRMAL